MKCYLSWVNCGLITDDFHKNDSEKIWINLDIISRFNVTVFNE